MSFLRAGSSLALSASNLAKCSPSSFASSSSSFSFSGFHTSASRLVESQKQRTARLVRKTNIERRAERARVAAANRPHVVLGTRPSEEETKWKNCDLAKTIVTAEELASLPPTMNKSEGFDSEAGIPKHLNYGVDYMKDGEGREMFFKALPAVAFENEALSNSIGENDIRTLMTKSGDQNLSKGDHVRQRVLLALMNTESEKAMLFSQVTDLRNANAKGIAFENRRRIIQAFSPDGTESNSGYPEVQVALLTLKIRNIWSHLMERKKDLRGRLAIRKLVHQRQKMLKYIKRHDRDRYDRILERVALEPEAVEGELVV